MVEEMEGREEEEDNLTNLRGGKVGLEETLKNRNSPMNQRVAPLCSKALENLHVKS